MARTWPRLTKFQRDLIRDFDKSKDGTKSVFLPRSGNALERLVSEGMIKFITGGGYGEFYSITQRGRDYVRFGLRKDI
jgi:hypothetical protein